MSRDQAIGLMLLAASIIVILAYIWLIFFPPIHGVDIFILKLTGAVAVAGIFAILGWIGYTLATTPPPKPIEEIEKEIEQELEKIKEQEKTEEKQS
ncbi:MAG: transcriptional regulator [Thermoproteota archaeon]|nr:transcriptional regulator [Candidatus Bathyarchaeota archaeon]